MRPYRAILVALAAIVTLAACDLVRPNDPLELDPDIVAVEAVLFEGSEIVHVIAGFPHRASVSEATRPALSLLGPTTSVPLQPVGPVTSCLQPGQTPFLGRLAGTQAMECFRAELPFRLERGVRYRIEGAGPAGPFTGETLIPSGPVLLSPVDELVLERDEGSPTLGSLDLSWETPADVAIVMYAVENLRVTAEDGSTRSDCSLFNNPLPLTTLPEEGEVRVSLRGLLCPSGQQSPWTSLRFDLRLVGFDEAFARFLENADLETLRAPLPTFGLTGAVGFFGAAGVSETVEVVVR